MKSTVVFSPIQRISSPYSSNIMVPLYKINDSLSIVETTYFDFF